MIDARLLVTGTVVLATVGCDARRAADGKPKPSASSAGTKPSASAEGGEPRQSATSQNPMPSIDWDAATRKLRDTLKARGVELAFEMDKDVAMPGCDGKKYKFWRKGRRTRGFGCRTCTPVTQLMREDTIMPGGPSSMVDAVAQGLSSYPAALVKKTELESVRLCGRLMGAQNHAGGIVDPFNRAIYLAVARGTTAHTAMHHEMFHVFDMSVFFAAIGYHDKEWLAANEPTFRYGSLRRSDALPKGILSHYASTKAREDRAVVFERIMTQPKAICDRIATDQHIAAKVNILRRRVKAAFGDDGAFLDRQLQCETAVPR